MSKIVRSIYIDEVQQDKIKAIAKKRCISFNKAIAELLNKALEVEDDAR